MESHLFRGVWMHPTVASFSGLWSDLQPIFARRTDGLFRALGRAGKLRYDSRIAFKKGRWSEPKTASFFGWWNDSEPSISPNGEKLFFTSNRPIVTGGLISTLGLTKVSNSFSDDILPATKELHG